VRGLSDSETLPFWLSKHYKTSSKDVTLYVPTNWYPGNSELESTDFFNPLAGDNKSYSNDHIGIEIPLKGQNQYETFVCHVLDNVIKENYNSREVPGIVKLTLKFYESLLEGKGMTFMDDSDGTMNWVFKRAEVFARCIIDRTGPGLLLKICKSAGKKVLLFEGPAHTVSSLSWLPENETGSFFQGYIKKAWGGRGITAVDKFLLEIEDREAIEFLYDSNYPYDG
jgi:hypothetical protein